MAQGNWEGAMASFNNAVKHSPENIEYQYALRKSSQQAIDDLLIQAANLTDKQQAKAIELYRKVLMLSPTNPRALEQLKSIEYAQYTKRLFQEATQAAAVGREQEARAKFKKLIAENPSNSEFRTALKELDERTGKTGLGASLNEGLLSPVTVSFKDASIKMVFDALSASHTLNFVMDRDLKDDTKINLNLRNVPFDEALDQILASFGLAKRIVNSNTVMLYQNTAQKLREFQDLVVRNFFIESADVKQLSAMLKTVLKIRDIHTDEKRNLLVIRDTPLQIAAAEKIIAAHDQGEPEVVLDVEIVELDHKLSESLGIQFPSQIGFGLANPLTLDALRAVNGSAVNVTGLSSLLQLNMQSQTGVTRVLANPRIRIRNREKAKFHVGDKVPVITTTSYPGTLTGATTSAVSYLDVGIKLEFEPVIQIDDQVVIKTSMEDSSITNTVVNNGTTAYQIGTRNVSTTLTLRDGETQVLAGLIRTDEQNTTNQVPGLGQIPGLGRAFQNPSNANNKKEILLSITPHVVHNIHRPTDDLLQINAGPEAQSQPQGPGGAGAPSAPRPSAPPVSAPPNRGLTPVPTPASPTAASQPMLTPLVPFGQTAAPPVTAAPVATNPATPAAAPAATAATSTNAATAAPAANLPVFEMPPGVGTTRN